MQTLVFNTSTKSVKLYEGQIERSSILFEIDNVPTVKILEGFYEVRQKDFEDKTFPILRLPISNTNMLIKK